MRARQNIREGTGLMNEDKGPGSSQPKIELPAMNRERLQAELDKALADLEDLNELGHGFLGQTGVHIGMRVLKSARRQFEQEENGLKERIALLEELLRSKGCAQGKDR